MGYSLAQKEDYKDFSYSYEVTDEDGNVHTESRQQDQQGVVSGTMLYRLVTGLFRNARYEATPEGGFTIIIESNEPGLGNESPASATFNIQDGPGRRY